MPNQSTNNKRIAKNSFYMCIRMVIVLFISLYTTRVLLEVLGVEDYGVYNVVCGFVALFGFLNTSMSNGIQRFFNFELGKNGIVGAEKVFNTALIIQAILALTILLLTETIGLWYLHNKMVIPQDSFVAAQWIFQFTVVSFIFLVIQAPFVAAIMAHECMDFYALVSVLDAVLKLGIVFVIPYLQGNSLIIYGLLLMSISVFNFLLYFVYCRKNFDEIKFKFSWNKRLFKSMLGFSGWNLFGSFSSVMREQGIDLVMNFFFGPIVNAARGVAIQVNGGLQSLVNNITIPVRPQVIQSYANGNIERTINLTYSISKLSCCFLLMAIVPLVYEINFVLSIWLGDNIPSKTAVFTIIVIFNSLISNLNATLSGIVHASGIMKNYQLYGSIMKMLSVPIAIIVLKIGAKPEFVLCIVLLCDILAHIVGLFIVNTIVNISLWKYTKEVVLPLVVMLILSLLITYPFYFFLDDTIIRFIIILLVGISSVVLMTYFVVLNRVEKNLVIQIVQRILIKARIRKCK